MTKLSDAVAIRDRAMAILTERGQSALVCRIPSIVAFAGSVELHLNEGKDLRTLDPRLLYSDPALAAIYPPDDHDLYVFAPGTVLHLRWNDDGSKPHLVSFKRGPWESAFALGDAKAA